MSPGTKKCVRRRRRKRFLSVFLAVAIWSRSPRRFWLDFSLKIAPESREFFHASTCFFLDGATSRIVCNLHIETHFFIFCFFVFFTEKKTKNQADNHAREKLSKKSLRDPPGSHFGAQNRLKSRARHLKNQKTAEKSSFGWEPFFDHVFERIFLNFLCQN